MKKLTVSIVSGRSQENLKICLESLTVALDNVDSQLVVTDNCSEWDVPQTVRKYFPEAEIITNSRQLGFGHNHNNALLNREDDYALVVNDDIEADPRVVDELLEVAENQQKGAIFGPILFPGSWKSDYISAGGKVNERLPKPLLTATSLIIRLIIGNKGIASILSGRNKGNIPANEKKGYISGAFCLIRREYIKKHGLYDQEFYMYYDDIDLGRRAREAGYECWQVGKAKVIHKEGGSFSPRTWTWIADSTLRYAQKYHGLFVKAIVMALLSIMKLLLKIKGVK